MKHNRFQAYVISTALSFCLGFSTIGCMVTGLELDAELGVLAFGCLLICLVLSILLAVRKGGRILLIAGALFLLYAVLSTSFRERTLSMLRDILSLYQYSYGLTLPEILQDAPHVSHNLPLLALHSIIALACSWTVLRRCTVSLAVTPALLCLATCFVVTDTVPALEYILLWFFALILLLLTHPVRLQNADRGVQLTKFLAIPVAVAVLGLSLMIPQHSIDIPTVPADSFETLWNWALSKLPFVGRTSDGEVVIVFTEEPSQKVSLDTLGSRVPVNVPVLEVTSDHSGPIYLREQDFDRYTGTDWVSEPERKEEEFSLPRSWVGKHMSITVHTFGRRSHRFIPCYPDNAPVFSNGIAPNEDYSEEYIFNCVTLADNWEFLWKENIRAPSQAIDGRYLALPDQTFADAQALLAQINGLKQADALEKAQLIGQYVQSIGRYDLNTAPMPDDREDFAIWFLQEGETGYCVHYATAATVLLRAAGIPARYVEGYMDSTKAGKTTVVRESRAHAWVEYYLDGGGWMILDPTPAAGTGVIPGTTPQTTQPTSSTTPPGPTAPNTTVPTTQPTTTRPAPSSTPNTAIPTQRPGIGDADAPDNRQAPAWVGKLLTGLIILGVSILAVEAQYYLRRKWICRQMGRGKPNAQALARYKEARRLARMGRLTVPEELTQLAEKACFSQHRLTQDELSVMDNYIKDCSATLQETGLLRRLYLRYIRAAY